MATVDALPMDDLGPATVAAVLSAKGGEGSWESTGSWESGASHFVAGLNLAIQDGSFWKED